MDPHRALSRMLKSCDRHTNMRAVVSREPYKIEIKLVRTLIAPDIHPILIGAVSNDR